MSDPTTAQKARIHDGANAPLSSGAYSSVSSDSAVASISTDSTIFVEGESPGTATITTTRDADGATSILEVLVTAAEPFTTMLGPSIAQ